MWDEIVYNLECFFNQPITIIVGSILSFGVMVLVIISKTSIGKKALNLLKCKYEEITLKYNEVYNAYSEFKTNKEKEISEIKELYESKLAIVESEKTELENLVYAIADNIHNTKVKELVDEYKELAIERKGEVMEIIEKKVSEYKDLANDYKEKALIEIDNAKAELETYKESFIAEKEKAEEIVKEYETKLNELKEKGETLYAEQKELVSDLVETQVENAEKLVEENKELIDEVLDYGERKEN